MPFHLGDAFDWAQAVIEKKVSGSVEPAGDTAAAAGAESTAALLTGCVWCGLPLITPDEHAWSLCSYCRLGEGEPSERRES